MKKSAYIGPTISRYQFEGLKNKGWITEYALEVYKRRPNTVALLELDIGSRFQKVVIKSFGWRNAKDPFFSPFTKSRAEKAWEATHWLLDDGIPVPKPIAVYTARQVGFINQNILITEYVGAHQKSSRIFESGIVDFVQKRDVAMKIAEIVAAVHNAGYLHHDLVKDNFLVTENKDGSVFLVDLTLVERKKKITPEERMDDVAKLDLCSCNLDHDHDDCLWLYFILAYDNDNAENLLVHLKKSIQKYQKAGKSVQKR